MQLLTLFVCLSVCLDMGPVFIYEQIPAADGRAYVRAYIHTYIHSYLPIYPPVYLAT